MSEVKIKITTEAELTAAEKAAKEMENLQKATRSAGDSTDRLTGRKLRLLEGFKALGAEIPIVNTLLMAGRNVYALLGIAAVSAYVAIRNALREAKEEQAAYNRIVSNVRVSIEAYSDLEKAILAVKEAQKALEDQTKNTNEVFAEQIAVKEQIVEGEINLLDAEEQRQAALIERDTEDPVTRDRKLRENELSFGARRIGLRSALGREQVGSIDKQIAAERALQDEARESVPNEAGLRGTVQGVEQDRQELEAALKENRSLFRRAELLRTSKKAAGEMDGFGQTYNISRFFNEPQAFELERMGVLARLAGDGGRFFPNRINELLTKAEPASAAAAERVSRLRSSLRSGLGSLPAKVAASGNVTGFMSAAESSAAETMNASYEREQALLRSRERLERERANKAAVGGIQQQTAGIRGDVAISQEDERQAAQVNQEIQRASSRVKEVTSLLGGTVVRKFDDQAATIEALTRRIANLERGRAGSSQASR